MLRRELTNGLNLQSGSIAVASSFTIGLFPIMGFSTPMNTAAAWIFRLNQPIVQVINWIMAPLKLALIIPFLRLGEWLFAAEPFTLSLSEFTHIFFEDWLATTREFAWTFAHAIFGWLIAAPLIFLLVYLMVRVVLTRRLTASTTDSTERGNCASTAPVSSN